VRARSTTSFLAVPHASLQTHDTCFAQADACVRWIRAWLSVSNPDAKLVLGGRKEGKEETDLAAATVLALQPTAGGVAGPDAYSFNTVEYCILEVVDRPSHALVFGFLVWAGYGSSLPSAAC